MERAMGTNEQIARLILQQTWEEREAMAKGLSAYDWKSAPRGEIIGTWASQFLEAAEQPQPEPDAQDDDGWIEWEGGKCPVPPMEEVKIRFRDGRERTIYRADYFRWDHLGSDADIIAYKVIKP
jgi:hypothetical protein